MPPTPAQPMPQLDVPRLQMFTITTALGVVGESLGQESQLADYFGVKEGVLVREVTKGSAAEKAGLKAGDVITKIDDTVISSPQQIQSALRAARAKGNANVTVVRNKKEMSMSVAIAAGGIMRGGIWFPMGDDDKILLRFFPNVGQSPAKIFWQ